MEALLAKYSSSQIKAPSRGDKVKGKVIQKLPKKLVMDIGGKSEGIVAEKAFEEARGFIDNLEIGDEVEAVVLIPETNEGFTILSLRQAASRASWDKLLSASKAGKQINVHGRFINPSGIIVDVLGFYGFIPNSQISKKILKDKEKLVGKEFIAIIIEIDKNSNRLILSEKAASEGITPEIIRKAYASLVEGEVYSGVVTTVSDFGVFAEIETTVDDKKIPVEGLVHVSEVSWEKVQDPHTVINKGEKIKVKVIGSKGGKLALSIKQALKDPWDEVDDNYKVEQKVTGKVAKITDFGMFLQLGPGVEGLIHITKIPPDKKFRVGDKVDATIEEIDAKHRKISLGLVLTQKPLLYK